MSPFFHSASSAEASATRSTMAEQHHPGTNDELPSSLYQSVFEHQGNPPSLTTPQTAVGVVLPQLSPFYGIAETQDLQDPGRIHVGIPYDGGISTLPSSSPLQFSVPQHFPELLTSESPALNNGVPQPITDHVNYLSTIDGLAQSCPQYPHLGPAETNLQQNSTSLYHESHSRNRTFDVRADANGNNILPMQPTPGIHSIISPSELSGVSQSVAYPQSYSTYHDIRAIPHSFPTQQHTMMTDVVSSSRLTASPLQSFEPYLAADQDKLVRCELCPELFQNVGNAKRHYRGCHPQVPHAFRCNHCTASYEAKSARTVHMRKAHPEIASPSPGPLQPDTEFESPVFRCNYPGCEKVYSAASNLKRHHEMFHLEIRYPCPFCSYQGTTKSNLKVHFNRMHY